MLKQISLAKLARPIACLTFGTSLILGTGMEAANAASFYDVTGLGFLTADPSSGLTGIETSDAYGANNSGQVVGWAFTANGSRAFLYSNGSISQLGNSSVISATSINNSGQVVGWTSTIPGNQAFLYSNGSINLLGFLPGGNPSVNNSYAYDINDSGQVVGYSNSPAGQQAFLYSGGTMIPLGFLPGGNQSIAHSINNNGQMVGSSGNVASTVNQAFLYSGGTMIPLGFLPGGNNSVAYGINDSGQVVGTSDSRAFLYNGGNLIALGLLPGGNQSFAYGINNSGEVVGQANTSNGNQAFLYSDGSIVNLNTLIDSSLGWNLLGARAINDSGQIVGYGIRNNRNEAFLLTPRAVVAPDPNTAAVPEPTSVAGLLLFGATAAVLRQRRKEPQQHGKDLGFNPLQNAD